MPLKFRKKASRKLTENDVERRRLISLINSMADAVIAVDEQIRIVEYNGAALNILDVNNIRKYAELSELLKPIDKNNQKVDINHMIKASKVPITNRELRLSYADTSIINLYISIAPVRLSYGQAGRSGYVIMLRDITHEKSLEEERDEFISVVSHELRTPIAIAEGDISNSIYVVDKSDVSADIKKSLHRAHAQVLFLADMINDLSTLSRAERGTPYMSIEKIDVKAFISELIKTYTPDAKLKGLSLHAVYEPGECQLYNNKLYLKEIMQNYITNALKYTTKGKIVIKVSPHPKGVHFSVEDSGIGISKQDQLRVFDKFFRSEDLRTRESSGTGLGLYVALKLARLMHADLSLKSQLNHGSRFTAFVPTLK
jgi:PAS domain S-box-containing protein